MRAVKSLKICTLIGFFCPKQVKIWIKKYRRVMCHDTDEWCKFWIKTDSWSQVWHEEFGEFLPNRSKAQKFHFDGLFSSEVCEVWAKIYRRVILHDTEQWCKIWINPDLVVSKMALINEWTFIKHKIHYPSKKIQLNGNVKIG